MALIGRSLGRPRTRADEVRQRRARAAHSASRPRRRLPPSPLPGTARPGARARPRRRRTLPLPVEIGAELSLPALPALRLSPRLGSAVLLGVWALIVHSAWTGPTFAIEAIEVTGTEMMSEAQVRSIANLRGRPAFLVDPRALEARLESYAEIDGTRVKLTWPNQVSILIEERRPIVEWRDGSQTWWLNAAGVAFIQREPYPGLVRIVAEQPVLAIDQDALRPAIQPEVLWQAVAIAEQLPHIGDLTYSPSHGIGLTDPRGWTVIFGQGGDLKAKLEVYLALASQLVEQGVVVEWINVENPAAPFYKVAR